MSLWTKARCPVVPPLVIIFALAEQSMRLYWYCHFFVPLTTQKDPQRQALINKEIHYDPKQN